MIISYDISELIPYINWPYFFFAWQVKEPSEKDRLRLEAEAFLQQLEGKYHAYGLFELFDAYSDGDDIVVIRGEKLEVRGERFVIGLCMLVGLLMATACQEEASRKGEPLEIGNAVYYWRTDLRLDSAERAFLTQNNIKKATAYKRLPFIMPFSMMESKNAFAVP